MEKKEYARELLKETDEALRKVKVMPDNMDYVTLYHTAHAFNSMGRYELSIDLCKALLKEIK